MENATPTASYVSALEQRLSALTAERDLLRSTAERLSSERDTLQGVVEKMQGELRQLRRMLFGRRFPAVSNRSVWRARNSGSFCGLTACGWPHLPIAYMMALCSKIWVTLNPEKYSEEIITVYHDEALIIKTLPQIQSLIEMMNGSDADVRPIN